MYLFAYLNVFNSSFYIFKKVFSKYLHTSKSLRIYFGHKTQTLFITMANIIIIIVADSAHVISANLKSN